MLLNLIACAALVQGGAETIPVTGKPIPEFTNLTGAFRDFLIANGINGGVLGIMKDGVIIYQRGFGWKDAALTVPMPYDAMFRVASVTKPMTAAVVQRRVADGDLDPDAFVFDQGQSPPGIIDAPPFGPVVDTRYADITVRHCIEHRGGWNRYASSPPFDSTVMDSAIMAQTPLFAPVGRLAKAQWMQGFPLQFDPGETAMNMNGVEVPIVEYSNEGFMMLGMACEAVEPRSLFEQIRDDVFDPLPWCPLTEIVQGRTFPQDQSPREPYYDSVSLPLLPSVFPPYGPVPSPYGGWDQESAIGHGGMVASTTALLNYAEHYYFNVETTFEVYGIPRAADDPRMNGNHGGLLPGTEAYLRQATDGLNYAFMINNYNWLEAGETLLNTIFGLGINTSWYQFQLRSIINAELGLIATLPTEPVDGKWADFTELIPGDGTFEVPFKDLGVAILATPDEGSINCQSSSTTWTGTISKRMRIRAHGGSVVIGE